MPSVQECFERFWQLGREEQALMAQRDTQKLGEVVSKREDVMREFIECSGQEQSEVFLDKLQQMQSLNNSLRSEARMLYQTLKDELVKLRSENRRLSGYRTGAAITPLHSRLISRSG